MLNLLTAMDRKVFLWVNQYTGSWLDKVFVTATFIGYEFIAFPLVLVTMLTFDRRHGLRKWIAFLFCTASVTLLIQIMKLAVGRARPWLIFYDQVAQGTLHLRYLLPLKGFDSFPSGHAATGFAIAATLNQLYPGKLRWLYAVAAVIALSRIYVGAHFLTDILMGSLIGVLFSRICFRLLLRYVPQLVAGSDKPE